MKTVQEYQHNAGLCRELANKMPRPEDRERLKEMAKAWDQLARSRGGKILAGVAPDDI